MRIKLALEWFLNPDHLPFIVAIREGILQKYNLELDIIEPSEHYDGLRELKEGKIQFATNEPLHLIEQFDSRIMSLGTFFETKGGVLLKKESFEKPLRGENIIVTTPVSNPVTDKIGFEIIRRFYMKHGYDIKPQQVIFQPNGFEHIKYMKQGADAAWLYFYNFEGIEAKHERMDVIYLDADNAGFPNISCLDIFTNKQFYNENKEVCENFDKAIKESIRFIKANKEKAMEHYYAYSKHEKTPLMDDIIIATIDCFDESFSSDHRKELPMLEFFRQLGITDLTQQQFKTAFLT